MIKYPELSNKNWIHQKYVIEKQSSSQIANLLGCHNTSVLKSLRSLGIKARSNSESHLLLERPSKYKLLNDTEWVRKKYCNEKLSMMEIAKIVGAKSSNSVNQFLRHAGVKSRSVSDGLTINRISDGFILNDFTQQVIEGGLLGDAHMSSYISMT